MAQQTSSTGWKSKILTLIKAFRLPMPLVSLVGMIGLIALATAGHRPNVVTKAMGEKMSNLLRALCSNGWSAWPQKMMIGSGFQSFIDVWLSASEESSSLDLCGIITCWFSRRLASPKCMGSVTTKLTPQAEAHTLVARDESSPSYVASFGISLWGVERWDLADTALGPCYVHVHLHVAR